MKKRNLLLLGLIFALAGCQGGQQTSSSITSSTSSSDNSSEEVISSVTSSSDSSEQAQSSSSSEVIGEIEGSSELYKATIKNQIPEGYYEPVRGLKGEELKAGLHEIIKGHDWYDYSKTQPFYKIVDRDPHDENKVNFIYTGPTNYSTSYNKEHVWAKSHGDFENVYPMHSDMHNLHPCNSSLNSTRGNKHFGEGGDPLTKFPGNNKAGTYFEPSDFSKGDVARTIFYMATRYEGEGTEYDLEVEAPTNPRYRDFSVGAKGTHGKFEYLYKWAVDGKDPVDDYEVSRNNIIYTNYQHNRNPFIDHPEFIEMIYDTNYVGAGALIDNNPYVPLTPEQVLEAFKAKVDAIDPNNLEHGTLITEALKYYENLSEDNKVVVDAVYQELLTKQATFDEFSKVTLSNQVKALIEEIGEVTLEDKTRIEQAEKAYGALSDAAKELVTNYQVLVDARTTYDRLYQEWVEAHPSEPFDFEFSSCTFPGGGYQVDTKATKGTMSFLVSHGYKSGSKFRLGHNKAASFKGLPKFDVLLPENKQCAAMEGLFDMNVNSLTLITDGNSGEIDKIYLLVSLDQGATWSLKETKDYKSSTQEYIFKTESGAKRYAIAISGSREPRLTIAKLSGK